jgi:arsenate reductase (thioredoxin)
MIRSDALGTLLVLLLFVTGFIAQDSKAGKRRILVLCTGNSARSQMAAGFLKAFDSRLEVYSAGTNPSPQINPIAVKAMNEVGIDISNGYPNSIMQFIGQSFDYVITVCDDADKNCPNFTGKVGKRLHIGFSDPAQAAGTDAEKMVIFRKVRDDIRDRFRVLYDNDIRKAL